MLATPETAYAARGVLIIGENATRIPRLTILLLLAAGTVAEGQNAPVIISVDASKDRHPISPLIYGVAFASAAQLSDLNVSLNRQGGNATTRYDWMSNSSNRAADWYYESIGETSATPGEFADTFIGQSASAGAYAMVTVPMIGWVARLGSGRAKLASFSVATYGPQQSTDYWMPDAGNGVRTNGTEVTGNDPHDANQPADSAYQLGWLQHLLARWGSAANGPLRYYLLDNEPSIWHATHRDVHTIGANMDEILARMIDYAGRVKSVDPTALVAGPEEWGWSGYFYSGYDQQWGAAHGWNGPFPDRAAHSNQDYIPWLLDQIRMNDQRNGRRLLDVLSVHYYPQGGEFGDDVSTAMQLRRNQSTRSLWDPAYVDPTWINEKVELIPRLHQWVDTYYPGTKIAITEYNWGAEGSINGATAQADILGIFGREGLDLATRWTTPDAATPTYKAIRMYRNYDGNHSTFGDVNVSASGPDVDRVSSFAAVRSYDHALTIMIVTKTLLGDTPATVTLAGFVAAGAIVQRWQLDSSNSIRRLQDLPAGSSISLTLPQQSVTLMVVPGAEPGGRRHAARH
ncbi:MAG TPA: glycoside hydrolase family 44 protein [Thermoanaerobaculia bacterium]|nr:glycoside hydrolase family 44 protein [Thermoanaerobaculia bacterium]